MNSEKKDGTYKQKTSNNDMNTRKEADKASSKTETNGETNIKKSQRGTMIQTR